MKPSNDSVKELSDKFLEGISHEDSDDGKKEKDLMNSASLAISKIILMGDE